MVDTSCHPFRNNRCSSSSSAWSALENRCSWCGHSLTRPATRPSCTGSTKSYFVQGISYSAHVCITLIKVKNTTTKRMSRTDSLYSRVAVDHSRILCSTKTRTTLFELGLMHQPTWKRGHTCCQHYCCCSACLAAPPARRSSPLTPYVQALEELLKKMLFTRLSRKTQIIP